MIKGGEFSFLLNTSRPVCVSVIDDVELVSCKLEIMYPAILKSQELTLTIMQLLSAINDYLTNQLKKAYFYNHHEKIAAFLLERNKKTIPYTHEEIASLTGLNRVTITKILNYFRQQGWIDISYHKIMIINHNSLNKVL